MKVFDFDGTLYDGDSSVDFFLYCLKTHPNCIRALPQLGIGALHYLTKRSKLNGFKSDFFSFLRFLDDCNQVVHSFWSNNLVKLKDNVVSRMSKGDLIVSASPSFLLKEPADYLGAYLIATEINMDTGQVLGKNCKGEEKIIRCKQLEIEMPFEEAYSDSLSDLPLFEASRQGYLVKKDLIIPAKIAHL